LDYARIKDFAAVGLLFKVGDDYIWKTHSFVRKGFLDTVKLEAPIKDWEDKCLLTIVDGPVIEIHHIVNWFVRMRELYGLTKIVADTFRLDLVKAALEEEGFEIEYIRNPKAIHSLLAPRVETIFAKHNLIYGDNPLMRWYTNNVYVKTKPDGNKEYLKKDEFKRKTDGFQAFIHALFKADELLDEDVEFILADINF
jgi:phage terminase large subunit-like protein